MPYDPTSPNPLDAPRDQVAQIQTNFAQFDAIFSSTLAGIKFNHTPLKDPREGDHETVILTNQTIDPDVTENLAALYTIDATSNVSIEPQLFYRILSFLPTDLDSTSSRNPPVQLTYNAVNVAGPQYQSFLAGGYLLYWGSTNDVTINITLSPIPTKILVAIAYSNTMTSGGTPVPMDAQTRIISNSQFKIESQTATGAYLFNWMVVAKA